ncbi:MAG: hypothetical protein R2828_35375 [Saprospiraceae bacterium]
MTISMRLCRWGLPPTLQYLSTSINSTSKKTSPLRAFRAFSTDGESRWDWKGLGWGDFNGNINFNQNQNFNDNINAPVSLGLAPNPPIPIHLH